MGSREVPYKIWARSVQPFQRLLDTNGQADKTNLYIDVVRGEGSATGDKIRNETSIYKFGLYVCFGVCLSVCI